MGMELFYVTVFWFFFCGGDGARIGGFAVFFEGGSGKGRVFNVVFLWCSYGELRDRRGEKKPRCVEVKNTPLI
jgi:hypothetical protein